MCAIYLSLSFGVLVRTVGNNITCDVRIPIAIICKVYKSCLVACFFSSWPRVHFGVQLFEFVSLFVALRKKQFSVSP